MRHSTSTLRRALALLVALLVAAPPASFAAERSRGSVRSVNRSGSGGSWSGARSSGTTSRTVSGNTASRNTTAQTRSGETVTGSKNVSKEGDTVTVNKNAQSTSGASRSATKEYEMDDGRVESVSRDVQATNRQGQTAEWEGKAEREGAGWKFEGEGTNRYGQSVEAEGYGARGPYGTGVVADIEGGRYGDRTVGAYKPYGGPTYVNRLPPGYTNYPYHGRSYYAYGGVYYRPYGAHYYMVPPPYGYCCYTSSQVAGAIMLTVVGMSLLYSNGVYYEKTYAQGETQYKVVPAPAGASVPQNAVPADAATVTAGGTTYYYYANTFYKVAPVNGQMSFVVVTKPAGVTAVAALPADFQPKQVGSLTYLVAGGRHYMPYVDASGNELYVVLDPPGGKAGATGAPATTTKSIPLTLPAGTMLAVRLAGEVSSGVNKTGDRFQGNLDGDLVAGGHLVAAKGARAYGRVVEAVAGTGMGGAPKLALEITDIQVGGRVLPVVTDRVAAQGEGKKPAKKILGGAALGAGIGAAIDGGEGAAWGAAAGAVVGTAAAKKSPGNQVAFAAGSALQFRTAQPLTVQENVAVASAR